MEFMCGKEALDRYIQRQARQDAEKHVAAPFVLVEPPSKRVLGYYTLSSSAVDMQNLPSDLAKKLPRYPYMPVTLLGRLAVDLSLKGRGQGEFLLMDALNRSWQAAKQIGAMAVLVDAKDAEAKAFYEHFGFIPLHSRPTRLFLAMKTVEMLFGQS
ncbi:MAG: GNAT family N-acetyltransferase [Thiobacillaceae bacterium]